MASLQIILINMDKVNEIFCSCCRVRFTSLTEYKLHLSTEFHVYNAKRRGVSLAPITLSMFEEKKRELVSASSSEVSDQKIKCKPCNKTFASNETYENHCASKKHKKKVKDSPVEQPKNKPSSTVKDYPMEQQHETTMDSLRISLFDNHKSDGIKKNLDYMRKKFSFFILDIDCLISLKALLFYLAEKIHVNHMCIYCHKQFKSAEAAQNHMVEKGHCFMSLQDFDEEYEPFYDFSPTYEKDFVGKTLEDFDLSEEKAKQAEEKVKTAEEKTTSDIPSIVEEKDDDDDWEDVDMDDDDSSSFQMVSKGSNSDFTVIDESKVDLSSLSQYQSRTLKYF